MLRHLSLGAVPFLVVVACSGSSSSGSGASADQACQSYAEALCRVVDGCAPIFLQVEFGDVATCVTRSKLGCTLSAGANGTSITPEKISSCASVVSTLGCDQIFGR